MRATLVTIAFAPSRVFKACVDQIYKTIGCEVDHHVLNNHYPVNEAQNDAEIVSYCKEKGIHLHDKGENIGLSAGYDFLVKEAAPTPDAVVMLADPDTFPINKGWGEALYKVASDPMVGIASLMFATVHRELQERGHDKLIFNGYNAWSAHKACMNSICAIRRSRLEFIGGLAEPKKYYGGAEGSLAPRLKKQNWAWAYLPDYWEEWHASVASEPIYREYKVDYALRNRTNLSFKDWLKEKNTQK